jgi:transglutaminase-like putative cysteine protease
MPIRVALHHKTDYQYDRLVGLSPQVVRLRPAPHCRTPITAYSLKIEPTGYFINWQQDPQSNYLARLVFPEPVKHFSIEVGLVAEMTVINPFDFFLEDYAERFPFRYAASQANELAPYVTPDPAGQQLRTFLDSIDLTPRRTMDFLVELNQRVQRMVRYVIRMEPGVQTCEDTLKLGTGSCRDSAWLLVQRRRALFPAT